MWTLIICEGHRGKAILSKQFKIEQDAHDYWSTFYILAQETFGRSCDFYYTIHENHISNGNENVIEEMIDTLIKQYNPRFMKEEIGLNFDSDYVSLENIEETKNGDFKQGLMKIAYEIVNKIPDLKYRGLKDELIEEIPTYIKEHM